MLKPFRYGPTGMLPEVEYSRGRSIKHQSLAQLSTKLAPLRLLGKITLATSLPPRVGTSLRLHHLLKGGQSWKAHEEGMPQSHHPRRPETSKEPPSSVGQPQHSSKAGHPGFQKSCPDRDCAEGRGSRRRTYPQRRPPTSGPVHRGHVLATTLSVGVRSLNVPNSL